MRQLLIPTVLVAALGIAAYASQTPAPQTQTPPAKPPASADPYANNPDAGAAKFPLAAPAGKDSGAINTAPPGSVNTGAFNPANWKYGPAFDAAGRAPRSGTR